jgi:peptidoglycan hydrolase-like protein with peptidoglycan-binding domain
MAGPQVREIQQRLLALGYRVGAADGVFGAVTAQCVRQFQQDHQLTVDGVVGPATLAALEAGHSSTNAGSGEAQDTTGSDQHVAVLQRYGVLMPMECIAGSQKSGLPLAVGAAILLRETGGGRNEWGHDPTIFVGGFDTKNGQNHGPLVDAVGYKAYLTQRGPTGAGGMQGVGPVQLTYYTLQDQADALGGCWVPINNITVGFTHLAGIIKNDGLHAGVAAYNGAGPAAEAYADWVVARAGVIQQALGGPPLS